MATMAPSTTTTMMPLRIRSRRLCCWASAARRASRAASLTGSLLAGHGRRPYPIPGTASDRPPRCRGRRRVGTAVAVGCGSGRHGLGSPRHGSGDGTAVQSVASAGCRWSCRSSVGPRSATPIGSGRSPTTSRGTRREGLRRGGRGQRHGEDDRRAHPPGQHRQHDPAAPRVRHARQHRGADLDVAAGDGAGRPRRRGAVVHREPGRHHHRRRPHAGQDQGGQGRSPPRGPRRRQGAGGRRLPGRLGRPRDHHPRPRRVRRHRRGAGRHPRRRRVRDLHRCHGRVHRRPPAGARGPPHQPDLVRRDARDGCFGRPGADARAPSSSPATTTSRCTYAAASPGSPVPGWWRRMQTWKTPSSPR